MRDIYTSPQANARENLISDQDSPAGIQFPSVKQTTAHDESNGSNPCEWGVPPNSDNYEAHKYGETDITHLIRESVYTRHFRGSAFDRLEIHW